MFFNYAMNEIINTNDEIKKTFVEVNINRNPICAEFTSKIFEYNVFDLKIIYIKFSMDIPINQLNSQVLNLSIFNKMDNLIFKTRFNLKNILNDLIIALFQQYNIKIFEKYKILFMSN